MTWIRVGTRAKSRGVMLDGNALLYWGLALMGLSLLLLVLEVFVPSAGVIGILAALSAIGGIVLLFRHDTGWGLLGVLVVAVAGPAAFMLGLKAFPWTPVGRALIAQEDEQTAERRALAELATIDRRRSLLGATGVALGDLHPVGEVEIDGQTHQALSEHEWIDAGARVVVTDASGLDLRVRRA